MNDVLSEMEEIETFDVVVRVQRNKPAIGSSIIGGCGTGASIPAAKQIAATVQATLSARCPPDYKFQVTGSWQVHITGEQESTG